MNNANNFDLIAASPAELVQVLGMATALGMQQYDGKKSTLAKWTGLEIGKHLQVRRSRLGHGIHLRNAFVAGWFQADMEGKPS